MRALALMHDAAEAYVGDVPTPLKSLLPDFRRVEDRVWRAVCRRFGISEVLPPEIKEIDLLALAIEREAVFPGHAPWPGLPYVREGLLDLRCHNFEAHSQFLLAAEVLGLR